MNKKKELVFMRTRYIVIPLNFFRKDTAIPTMVSSPNRIKSNPNEIPGAGGDCKGKSESSINSI